MTRDVAITGFGVIGAFGVGPEALAAACLGAPLQTERYPVEGGSLEVGQASFKLRQHWPGLPIKLGRVDRGSKLFLVAGRQAMEAAGMDGSEPAAVVLGSRFGCLLVNESYHRGLLTRGYRRASPLEFGYTVPSAPAGELSIAAQLTGPNLTVVAGAASGGSAGAPPAAGGRPGRGGPPLRPGPNRRGVAGDGGGGSAVARAADWIRTGRVDRAVAGGCDAQGAWLAQELHDAGVRDGAGPLPAEGSAALVLESLDGALARGAPVHALLGPAREGFSPAPATGPGFVDPLADVIGRTYAAAAPLALAAMAGRWLPPGSVRVEDELGHWIELEVLPAPTG